MALFLVQWETGILQLFFSSKSSQLQGIQIFLNSEDNNFIISHLKAFMFKQKY